MLDNLSMTDLKWFVLSNSSVYGPYSPSQVEEKAAGSTAPLIWGRGLSEWVSLDKWRQHSTQAEINERNAKQANERLWKIQSEGIEHPPMSYSMMMEFLKSKDDLGEIRIWTEGFDDWKEIYEIHKIMDELGVSRRAHPRVPIMGTADMEVSGSLYSAKIISISEGGAGLETETSKQSTYLRIGAKIRISIKSPNLYNHIHTNAEVVYMNDDGYVGVRFLNLPTDSKTIIFDYVKKFTDTRKDHA